MKIRYFNKEIHVYCHTDSYLVRLLSAYTTKHYDQFYMLDSSVGHFPRTKEQASCSVIVAIYNDCEVLHQSSVCDSIKYFHLRVQQRAR